MIDPVALPLVALLVILAPVWLCLLYWLWLYVKWVREDIVAGIAGSILILIILAGAWMYVGAIMDPDSLAHSYECDIPGSIRPAVCQ